MDKCVSFTCLPELSQLADAFRDQAPPFSVEISQLVSCQGKLEKRNEIVDCDNMVELHEFLLANPGEFNLGDMLTIDVQEVFVDDQDLLYIPPAEEGN